MSNEIKPPAVIVDPEIVTKLIPSKNIREASLAIMHLHRRVFGFDTKGNGMSGALVQLAERCVDKELTVRERNDSLKIALDYLSGFNEIMGKHAATGKNGMMVTPDMILDWMTERHVKAQFDSLVKQTAEQDQEIQSLRSQLAELRGAPDTPSSPSSDTSADD